MRGEIIELTPAGRKHNRIASNIELVFRIFYQSHPDLAFGGDNDGFLLKRDPLTLRSPDACLYRRRPNLDETTWLEFTPEVVVEVVSPSNNPVDLAYKRHAFFEAGTEQFWLVDPDKRQIQFIHRDGRIPTATGDEVVECEGIAEGMRLSLSEVFDEG